MVIGRLNSSNIQKFTQLINSAKYNFSKAIFTLLCIFALSSLNGIVYASDGGSSFGLEEVTPGIEISGKVLNEKGEPLTGVNVIVKGKNIGAATDYTGDFTLELKVGDVLEISYAGYKTVETTISDKTQIKVTLQEESNSKEEVVVIGYGSKKK
ncbi:carboxypeptidase-like regulatory domain-containing protein [Membranihabitans marinus]|uniref:carboxypeptidase-like regulatory domain-containing protein n=1 Tax=Membranihabitans marinus TaxID=1227546 RepID=UPI001F2B341E|nr:carboxypeptidase-like regulatory domain-containing protein [Membranihabitans marinus]